MREKSGPPAFAWRGSQVSKSETWGTHRLFQEGLTQTLPGWAMFGRHIPSFLARPTPQDVAVTSAALCLM